ncbi:MAG: MscL family protein [Candidatus Thorarchaeota archaeon]|nr:MAG: MscL family protein [Candidatus Thorarchaeota archaeon]
MSTDEQILEQLTEIRKLLTPAEPPPPPEGFINEFTTFLSKYKVLGLAVAFILGLYLGALVQALVGDLIMPLITVFIPDVAWDEIVLGPFMVGHFIGELITFIIIAFVVFLLVKFAARIGID